MSGVMCKLCLSVDYFQIPLFSDYGKSKSLSEKIYSCFQLNICENNRDFICYKCVEKVESFHTFKDVVMKAQGHSVAPDRTNSGQRIDNELFKVRTVNKRNHATRMNGSKINTESRNKSFKSNYTNFAINSMDLNSSISGNNGFNFKRNSNINPRSNPPDEYNYVFDSQCDDEIDENNVIFSLSEESDDGSQSFKLTPEDGDIYKLPALRE